MRALLACLAISAVAAGAPAAAVEPGQMAFTGVSVHSGFGGGHHGNFHRRRGHDGVFIYDRDYQGDTAWKSDSFNDWWHDRTAPIRAGCWPTRIARRAGIRAMS